MSKYLIPMDEFGLMADSEGVARVDSRYVADAFEKNHKDVLYAIRRMTGEGSGYSPDFIRRNFTPIKFIDARGRKQPCILMTRDGFCALVMSFTGKKADQFKEAYICRFNEMEGQIKLIRSLRDQNPMLTKAIQDNREDPKPYDYSNELDMLNRIVLGMSAKQYREENGIPKGDPIRPHFTAAQAEMMDKLMMLDTGFQYSVPDYQQRKHMLEWYAITHPVVEKIIDGNSTTKETDAA